MMLKSAIKRSIALVLSVALLFSNFSLDVFAEEQSITVNLKTYLSAAPEARMSHDAALAESINTQLKNFAERVDISDFKLAPITENINKIVNILSFELPECFHIGESIEFFKGDDNYLSSIKLSYIYEKNKYEQMLAECKAAADKTLRGVEGNDKLSDVEKLLILHDRIALACEYDKERLDSGTLPKISHSMYGVFVNGLAVCQGYALAYAYLLDRIGIENYFCDSQNLNHVWNIVYVDGKPYHVDITWDDPTWDITGRVDHENFLVSTEKLIQNGHYSKDDDKNPLYDKEGNHIYDYDGSPTDKTYDNYFWQNVDTAFILLNDEIYYIDSSDKDTTKQHILIKRCSDNTTLYETEQVWKADGGYYRGNYARLSVCGSKLLFSLSDGIYSLNPENNAVNQILYKQNLGVGYNIYGFTYSDGMLIYDLTSSPNFTVETKKKFEYKVPYHDAGNINEDGYIDLLDVTVFAKALAGWQIDCNSNAFDVNGDQKTNLNDLVHLAQYVAGWQGIAVY